MGYYVARGGLQQWWNECAAEGLVAKEAEKTASELEDSLPRIRAALAELAGLPLHKVNLRGGATGGADSVLHTHGSPKCDGRIPPPAPGVSAGRLVAEVPRGNSKVDRGFSNVSHESSLTRGTSAFSNWRRQGARTSRAVQLCGLRRVGSLTLRLL